jgi:hypothetical protein
MSRAQIKVEANERITIDRTQYRVAEHPALPGIPYMQRGARGVVIQLVAPNGDKLALKYFKLKYRVPALVEVTEALKQYASLPGLRAAQRKVFTQAGSPELIASYPALEYGVLMPWIPGVTWYDVITRKTSLTAPESFRLAKTTSEVLAGLEENGLAHCDIAGANVMVDRRSSQVELVDIEEMYGKGLPQPVELPAGQDGYQHRTSRQMGQWTIAGDRFGTAVLLAEMLGWADSRIRSNSADEHYFSAAEVQDGTSPRYRLLYETLRDTYDPSIADLFERAWTSPSLAECPSLQTWYDTLDAVHIEAQTASAPADSPAAANPVVSGRRKIDGVPIIENPKLEQHGPERLQLEGTRLCRNCGAQNAVTASFCKRCGFYIGTGARPTVKPPVASPNKTSQQAQQVSGPPQPVVPTGNTAPQAVPLQRNNQEIIAARRIGGPDGQLQRVATPQPPAQPDVEGNIGMYLVLALIIGAIITALVFVLIAK